MRFALLYFGGKLMDSQTVQEKAQEIIRKVAVDLNYLIYESAILVKGEQSQIVVKIDRVEGIAHRDCVIFTKELSVRLDDANIFPNYSMEISSPGLSRKLRSVDEFIRFKGSPAKVVFESDGKAKVIKGIINNIIDTKIELQSDNNNIIIIDFKDIKKANLEY
jgi:ribosome maturation factor RimP